MTTRQFQANALGRLWLLGASLVAGGGLLACTIPVFRYALDRWEADPYRLVVPSSWATDPGKLRLLVPLRGNGVANVVVEERDEPGLATARLLFPHHDTAIWEGALDADSMTALLDSPGRREILARILAGDSVVWVVCVRENDRAEVDRIEGRLRFLEQVAALPMQDPSDPDSALGPGPPLRLQFSVVTLALEDPAEQHLAAMLAGPGHGDFLTSGRSFAAPVFGRGRVLGAWALAELDDTAVEDASLFLISRCSCRVKNQNPGWDLLLRTDWEQALAAAGLPVTEAAAVPEAATEDVPDTAVIAPTSSGPKAEVRPAQTLSMGVVSLTVATICLVTGLVLWFRR